MLTPDEVETIKQTVEVVFEAIQGQRTASTGDPPNVPGAEESEQLLRTATQDGPPQTWQIEPRARQIFEEWHTRDPRARASTPRLRTRGTRNSVGEGPVDVPAPPV